MKTLIALSLAALPMTTHAQQPTPWAFDIIFVSAADMPAVRAALPTQCPPGTSFERITMLFIQLLAIVVLCLAWALIRLMSAAAFLIVMAMCGAAWFLIFAVWAPVILINIR